MKNRKLIGFILVMGICCISSGCATNRGILDIQVPESKNPDNGKQVKITRVTDMRTFEVNPSEADIPSLKDNQIHNQTITSRAIARKRNGYGKAIGDILLPEGRSVEDLVRDALRTSLRKKGYSVLTENSATNEYNEALPIEVDIKQFWSWFRPGFWAAKLEFEAILDISGTALFDEGRQTIQGNVQLCTQAATTRAWKNTIMKGLENLMQNIQAAINPA